MCDAVDENTVGPQSMGVGSTPSTVRSLVSTTQQGFAHIFNDVPATARVVLSCCEQQHGPSHTIGHAQDAAWTETPGEKTHPTYVKRKKVISSSPYFSSRKL